MNRRGKMGPEKLRERKTMSPHLATKAHLCKHPVRLAAETLSPTNPMGKD